MKLQFALLLTVATLLNHAAPAAAAAEARDLALEGAKVYSSPAAAPIENAVVLIQHGRIAAVGKRSDVKVPASAQVIDCTGKSHRRRVLEQSRAFRKRMAGHCASPRGPGRRWPAASMFWRTPFQVREVREVFRRRNSPG
jgi:hypothetical protein